MKKQVIVLAFVLVMLFALIGFLDWKEAHVVWGGEIIDKTGGFLAGIFIVAIVGILISIVVGKKIA